MRLIDLRSGARVCNPQHGRFMERVKPLILFRRRTETVPTADDTWVLQEAVIPYGQKAGVKKASMTVN